MGGNMFESPMEHCRVCGEYVTLVQTQHECACRQQCGQDANCPLQKAFAATEFYRSMEGDAAPPRPAG
jgi:hypothetical protein